MNTARFLLAGMLLVAFPLSLFAEGAQPQVNQVVLVLWHGLRWDQVKGLNCSHPLAFGIMNTRSGGGSEPSASYLSIGAGARAVGIGGAAYFSDAQQAGDLYTLHTGQELAPFVQLNIVPIRAAQKVEYTVKPGALGSALRRAGASIRALGNSDGEEKTSWAALTAMDEWGRVWNARIGSGPGEGPVRADVAFPFGLRTEYSYLAASVLTAVEPLIIVDLGDPYRFDQYEKFLTEEQKAVVEAELSQQALSFLQDLAELKKQDTAIIVIGPHPGQARAERGLWLTPVLCIGVDDGLLVSGTTRWPGMITNMDVAPTVLALLNVTHNQPFIGREAVVVPHREPASVLAQVQERLEHLSQRRGPVLRTVIFLQILLYCSSLIVLIISSPPVPVLRFFQRLLLAFLSLPLIFVLQPSSPWLILVVALFVVSLESAVEQPLFKVGIIAAVTALAIAADVCLGSPLLRFSYLGYDPIGGARFYGLGNEFMGLLVGSAVLGWSVARQKYTGLPHLDWIGLLLFSALLGVIGAPALGTNVGGAICAIFAFGYTWYAFRDQRGAPGGIIILALLAAVVLALFMLVDQANPVDEQSHIGRTVALIRRDGLLSIKQIITRKLAMNLKLLRYSLWSRALIVAIAVIGAGFIYPSMFISRLKKDYPFIAMGMKGTVLGSFAALIFNDSGVVAAATCLYFASSTLLLLALQLKHDLDSPQANI